MTDRAIQTVSRSLCFGGLQGVYAHAAKETGCVMRFGVFLPPQANAGRVPLLYWLSGLTCTEENFIVKAGAQRVAAELGLAIVVPDTSPRGLGIPGEGDSYDFGLGAGFYVDASEPPWSRGYRMYSYITKELPEEIASAFPVDPSRTGIFGHSMGGHGALTIALKHPDRYKSVSAFAPIASPIRCPWGQKALAGYLGAGSVPVARLRCDGAGRRSRLGRIVHPGRSGNGRSVPGNAAQARTASRSVSALRRLARFAPARRL